MARFQRGWLRIVGRKQGRMWQLRYNAIDRQRGRRRNRRLLSVHLQTSRTSHRVGARLTVNG
jgi:hypothetical protein